MSDLKTYDTTRSAAFKKRAATLSTTTPSLMEAYLAYTASWVGGGA